MENVWKLGRKQKMAENDLELRDVYKWAGINILEAAIGPWCTKHGQVGQVGGLPLLYHKTPGKQNFWPRGARDMRLKNATRKSDRQCYDICCTMVFFPVVGLFDYVHITSTHTWLCHNLSLYKDISFLNCITCNLNIICLYLLQKLIRAQCKFFVGKTRYIVPPK